MTAQKLQLVNSYTRNLNSDVAADKIDYLGHDIKCALFLSTSNIALSSTSYTSLTNEVANGLGYTTGGISLTTKTRTLTGNVDKKSSDDVTWNASGGSITARYAVLYDNTSTNKPIIGFMALDNTPADVTATDGNPLTISPSTGWYTETPNNA